MWKNMAEPDKPQMKIKYGTSTFARLGIMTTDTITIYYIAFSEQLCLR
jgi:hypothetical protein